MKGRQCDHDPFASDQALNRCGAIRQRQVVASIGVVTKEGFLGADLGLGYASRPRSVPVA